MRDIAIHMIFSFLAAVSFGLLCNVPKRSVIAGGLIGTIGWITYIQLISRGFGVFLSSFTSAFLLAFAARAAASKFHLPITVYVVPGLVPIVPGITFYEALRRLIAGSDSFSGFGIVQVVFGAAGIACGIAIADVLYRSIARFILRHYQHR